MEAATFTPGNSIPGHLLRVGACPGHYGIISLSVLPRIHIHKAKCVSPTNSQFQWVPKLYFDVGIGQVQKWPQALPCPNYSLHYALNLCAWGEHWSYIILRKIVKQNLNFNWTVNLWMVRVIESYWKLIFTCISLFLITYNVYLL